MGVVKSETRKLSWGQIMGDIECQNINLLICSLGQHIFPWHLSCDILCPSYTAMNDTDWSLPLQNFQTNKQKTPVLETSRAQSPGNSLFLRKTKNHQTSIRSRCRVGHRGRDFTKGTETAGDSQFIMQCLFAALASHYTTVVGHGRMPPAPSKLQGKYGWHLYLHISQKAR